MDGVDSLIGAIFTTLQAKPFLSTMLRFLALLAGLLLTVAGQAQDTFSKAETALLTSIDAQAATYTQTAHQIWEWAELGYQETKSSAALQTLLRDAGFTVTKGVAEIPTAFMATYGSGQPIIGIMGEFDALPGISQAAVPELEPREVTNNGHACGHHLFGAGSAAAAIAVKDWLSQQGREAGTIRFYGTPAEEGGSGKVYMTRAGLFDDVDVMLHWHPGDGNGANPSSTLAIKSAKFRFYGQSAHAAAAPHRGRSALDGVEAMNHMVNLMREHTTEPTRIHYVITRGGDAPNVIPAFAEVYYYVRHPDRAEVKDLFERLVRAAEGAALGTDTQMDYEIIGGSYNVLPNVALAERMHANLQRLGGFAYTPEEQAFAERIQQTFPSPPALVTTQQVQPFNADPGTYPASTDVGDVSWATPTAGLRTATWVPGTSAHSWQAVAAGGMSIGHKGMILAAKTIALTAVELFQDPAAIQAAKAEWQERIGPDFEYESLIGDREPPLDYRN